MVTKDQALTGNEFHYGECTRAVGVRGGVTTKIVRARRNGATKTWKRDQSRFRVPIKHGMYEYGEITETNAQYFHLAADCPLDK